MKDFVSNDNVCYEVDLVIAKHLMIIVIDERMESIIMMHVFVLVQGNYDVVKDLVVYVHS